ncbi:MAG: dipeptidase [Saprospiraceae bacterium]|nr:dipeptidase [Saprospiraceae bacterium]
MPAYVIDLHCHPSLKPHYAAPYNSASNIWDQVAQQPGLNQLHPDVRKILDGIELTSQSNLSEMMSGNVRGAFMAIHPIERGWLDHKDYSSNPVRDCLLNMRLPEADIPILGAVLSGIPQQTIAMIKANVEADGPINYYHDDTYPEYQFLLRSEQTVRPDGKKFRIVTDFTEYMDVLTNHPDTFAGIITMEGAHALQQVRRASWAKVKFEDLPEPDRRYINNKYLLNLAKIKGLNTYKGFAKKHTPLFMTLAHFYNNFLTGHTKSFASGVGIMPGMDTLLDQEQGMNEGITGLGFLMIDRLLKKSEHERRILIDVKHMSWKARKQYYDFLIQRGDDIPIVFSHGGVNGRNAADFEAIGFDRAADHDNEYLARWSINLFDDDIRAIANSRGLMGIAPHEGRVPGGRAIDLLDGIKREIGQGIPGAAARLRREYGKIMLSNFYHIAAVINDARAWDHICIGSDYDGITNPFDTYPKSGNLNAMLTDIQQLMENPPSSITSYRNGRPFILDQNEQRRLQFGIAPSSLIAKIAFGNVELFLSRYFTEAYLGGVTGMT